MSRHSTACTYFLFGFAVLSTVPELLTFETTQRVRDKCVNWDTQVSASDVLRRLWAAEAEDDSVCHPPLTIWSVWFQGDNNCIGDALALLWSLFTVFRVPTWHFRDLPIANGESFIRLLSSTPWITSHLWKCSLNSSSDAPEIGQLLLNCRRVH